ncbi:MAG: hypothetical protein K2Z81_10475 [Cyanobacteria bacterium]|nr:hypothetical protein [Cyanobacteriota bacterium]
MKTKLSPDSFAWAFGRKTYADFSKFVVDFSEYNRDIMQMTLPLEDFPLTDSTSVVLLFSGVPDGAFEYEDLDAKISSRDGEALSFFEFMYLVNNSLYQYLNNSDHVYYEGLEEEGETDGVPTYRLVQGS